METFPTSAQWILAIVFATTTKICTTAGSTRLHRLCFDPSSTLSYSGGFKKPESFTALTTHK